MIKDLEARVEIAAARGIIDEGLNERFCSPDYFGVGAHPKGESVRSLVLRMRQGI